MNLLIKNETWLKALEQKYPDEFAKIHDEYETDEKYERELVVLTQRAME